MFDAETILRIFGKPVAHKGRRMAVVLTYGKEALEKAKTKIKMIRDIA
jgi:phosphoribosylglycinamide formyltransferase 2